MRSKRKLCYHDSIIRDTAGIKIGEALQDMWTVIYIAPTARVADMIQRKLTEEGFMIKCRPVNMSKQQFEILVPSGELEEVQEVLNLILHP
ncbi:hypothetical protein GCM10010912_34020 [Paenibacillus albidus]|uniref:Uncharacterized protein n=2 Tax=Paenibacillus albidus TaxID=2041023 RepID=A0A917FIN8_9BACL|nr:hypothetical protein GCM10010912_34020 [Paenibacillus albidus]